MRKILLMVLLSAFGLLSWRAEGLDWRDPKPSGAVNSPSESAAISPKPKVLFMTLASSINAGTADYIKEAIAEAQERQAQCLIIELDTPGGLLESTRNIVKDMLNADIPIVIYVGPRGAHAGSAGVFITLAAHIAAMSPGTNIGAAHPVSGSGKDPEEGGKHLAQKIENDTSAFIETIAIQRKRNVKWAREAVIESVSVTETKALELNVIDLIAASRADLLQKIDGKKIELPTRTVILKTAGVEVENLEMSWKQHFVDIFSDPNILYFLIIIASLGIYLELSHPGAIFPGVMAAFAVLMILISAQTLPIYWGGFLLILLAVILFILELYVTSYGLLAIGGLTCFLIGSLLLFDKAEGFGTFGVSKMLIFATSVVVFFIVAVVAYFVTRAQMRKIVTGHEGLIGQEAQVIVAIAPSIEGKVLVGGEYWQAVSIGDAPIGTAVEIIRVDGLKLHVRPTK